MNIPPDKEPQGL